MISAVLVIYVFTRGLILASTSSPERLGMYIGSQPNSPRGRLRGSLMLKVPAYAYVNIPVGKGDLPICYESA